MSKFLLRQTRDGMQHLYFDDPNNEGFIKVSKAKNAKFLNEHSTQNVILSNNKGSKTLFSIVGNKFFEVTLPESSKIKVIGGVCIYERENVYYTKEFNKGAWVEKTLGTLNEVFLSSPDNIKYKTCYWVYFTKNMPNGIELSYFVDGKYFIWGVYEAIKENYNGLVFALKNNNCYEIFTPISIAPLNGTEDEAVIEALGGVFLWNKVTQNWVFHEKCRTFGKNAVYRILGEYGKHIELYRINEEKLELVASGRWKWLAKKSLAVCIEEIVYSLDKAKDEVDFLTPKPTFKKRVKDFLKLK